MKRKAIAPVYSSLYIFRNRVVTILFYFIVTQTESNNRMTPSAKLDCVEKTQQSCDLWGKCSIFIGYCFTFVIINAILKKDINKEIEIQERISNESSLT